MAPTGPQQHAGYNPHAQDPAYDPYSRGSFPFFAVTSPEQIDELLRKHLCPVLNYLLQPGVFWLKDDKIPGYGYPLSEYIKHYRREQIRALELEIKVKTFIATLYQQICKTGGAGTLGTFQNAAQLFDMIELGQYEMSVGGHHLRAPSQPTPATTAPTWTHPINDIESLRPMFCQSLEQMTKIVSQIVPNVAPILLNVKNQPEAITPEMVANINNFNQNYNDEQRAASFIIYDSYKLYLSYTSEYLYRKR